MLEPMIYDGETNRKFSELSNEDLASIANDGVDLLPCDGFPHDEDFCKRYASILLKERLG